MPAHNRTTPNRRHIPFTDLRAAKAMRWLRQIADGPCFVLPTHTWTQQERDHFIVKNHLVQIFHPDHDLEIDRGILVRELPSFLRTGDDYRRQKHLAEHDKATQDGLPPGPYSHPPGTLPPPAAIRTLDQHSPTSPHTRATTPGQPARIRATEQPGHQAPRSRKNAQTGPKTPP